MRIFNARSCCLAACMFVGMQSLADIAREEAERRRLVEQEGIESRVIEGRAARKDPDARTESSQSSERPKGFTTDKPSSGSQISARSYRARLQKLDRAIRQEDERLELKRKRLESERWALPKTGRLSARSKSADVQERLQSEIEELQIKLRELRRERSETWEEGRKAGFLPGELEGRYY